MHVQAPFISRSAIVDTMANCGSSLAPMGNGGNGRHLRQNACIVRFDVAAATHH